MFEFLRRKPAAPVLDAAADAAQAALDQSLIIPIVKALVADDDPASVVHIGPEDAPISISFVADLIVMYVIDYPDRFEFVAARHLREAGISQDQLHELALRNLATRIPEIEMHGNYPCHMITAGGNLEATLLLHDPLWDQLAGHLPGEPMAVVPARDLLCVSGSGWDGAHAFLSSVADKYSEGQRYALSKCVLVRRAGQWQVFAPAS